MNHPTLSRKRKREEKEETERYSNWCDLPQTFLSSLLYFLSPKSRCAVKATCKSWNEAELLLPVPVGSPSSPYHSAPLLMVPRRLRKSTCYEFLHPMKDEYFHVNVVDDCHYLKDAKVCYSNFGWLLMERCGHTVSPRKTCLFFFNPFTKQKIELPALYTLLMDMCFTSPPTSSDCQVFGWSAREEAALLKLSDKNWKIYDFYPSNDLDDNYDNSFHSPVFYRGFCYCFVYRGRFGVCDLNNDCAFTFHDTNLFGKVWDSILLEVDGKLLGIFETIDEGIIFQWLDTERMEWYPIQPNDLQDKILYLSNVRSFVQCDDTTKGKGNWICIDDARRNRIIFYSLDTKKYHYSMDLNRCYEEGEITETGWYSCSTWISPTDPAVHAT